MNGNEDFIMKPVGDFLLFPDYEGYYSRFHIWEDSRREKYTDKLEIHVLELPKLKRYHSPETELLKWAKFFHAQTREEFEAMAKENEYLEKAYERLVNISADEKKRREYQAREDALRDYNWQMKTSWRRGVREGMQRGIETGRRAGIEEGKKTGIEEGRQLEIKRGIQILIMALKETGQTQEQICQMIAEQYDLKPECAQKYMEQFWH